MGGRKEEIIDSMSGSDGDGTSGGDDVDIAEPGLKRRKRHHRHTPLQIQEMELLFKSSPHPDEKQRLELSTALGLEPRQVKFWFQNRRTQMKALSERQENDRLQADNESLRRALSRLRSATCPNCGCSPEMPRNETSPNRRNGAKAKAPHGEQRAGSAHNVLPEAELEQRPRRQDVKRASGRSRSPAENQVSGSSDVSHKKEGRCSPPLQGISSVYASLAGSTGQAGEAHDAGAKRRIGGRLSEVEQEKLHQLAGEAMEELCYLAQHDEPIWQKQGKCQVLNWEEYRRHFPSCQGISPEEGFQEASRAKGTVQIEAQALVEILLNSAAWSEMFPDLIAKAVLVESVSKGLRASDRDGALMLMYAETQQLSPLVPTRESFFLRFCTRLAADCWGVADVSMDTLRTDPPPAMLRCRRHPSGFIVTDLGNGTCHVSIVEHVDVGVALQAASPFRGLEKSMSTFGAARWLALLQRQCQRLAAGVGGVPSQMEMGLISPSGQQSLVALAARMFRMFCKGLSASVQNSWILVPQDKEVGDGLLKSRRSCLGKVQVMTMTSSVKGQEPSGTILSAATSLSLPAPSRKVFDFLRNHSLRSKWDILACHGAVSEVASVPTGNDLADSVTLFKVHASEAGGQSILILQDTSWSSLGSTLVYAPVDIACMQRVIAGGDPGCIAVLPAGFSILPDGRENSIATVHSKPGHAQDGFENGCLLTMAFQILISTSPQSEVSDETLATVNSLVSSTAHHIRAAVRCLDA